MSRNFKGSKYEATKDIYDTAVIAKLFRADIKAAIKAGELPKTLKLGVRTSKYSGGSSINVRVKSVNMMVVNPERMLFDSENPHHAHGAPPRYTPEARALIETLESMLNAYNYDNSDTMSDYFCTKFYAFVDFDSELEAESRMAIAESGVAELAKAASDVRWAKEEAEMAEYTKRKEAEKAEREARGPTKWDLDRAKPDPEVPAEGVAIWFGWSETRHVTVKEAFSTFAEANAHLTVAATLETAEMARIGRIWPDGSYRKTGFTIAIDGETYGGRYDIGCDAPTLEEHVLSFCDPDKNPFLRGGSDEDKAEMAMWAAKVRVALSREREAELEDEIADKVMEISELKRRTIKAPMFFFVAPGGEA